jgi:hypothetical protein
MLKSPLKSRTLWVNALTLAAGIAAYLAGAEAMQDYQAFIPILVAIQGGVNIVLRFLTTEPIA